MLGAPEFVNKACVLVGIIFVDVYLMLPFSEFYKKAEASVQGEQGGGKTGNKERSEAEGENKIPIIKFVTFVLQMLGI